MASSQWPPPPFQIVVFPMLHGPNNSLRFAVSQFDSQFHQVRLRVPCTKLATDDVSVYCFWVYVAGLYWLQEYEQVV